MPASNVTRVRRLGFWKSIASVRPTSGGAACRRVARNSALSAAAVSNTRPTSSADRSATLSRSRPRNDEGVVIAIRSLTLRRVVVMPCAALGRSGEGGGEHGSERTQGA